MTVDIASGIMCDNCEEICQVFVLLQGNCDHPDNREYILCQDCVRKAKELVDPVINGGLKA